MITSKELQIEKLEEQLLVNDIESVPDGLLQDECRRAVRLLLNCLTNDSCDKERTLLAAQRTVSFLCRLRPDMPRPTGKPEIILVLATEILQQEAKNGTRGIVVSIPHKPPDVRRSQEVENMLDRAAKLLSAADTRGDLILLIAHGSLSTEDRTGFSDLDFLAVFRDSCFGNVNSIMLLQHEIFEFNRFLRSLDPLSHHGLNVLSESDLRSYDESFLPVRQLCLSSRILGPSQISMGLRNCRLESGRQLLRHASAIRMQPHNSYSTRLFLARIHLIPAVYLQCVHGLYVDKKTALTAASGFFPQRPFSAIRAASALRKKWCKHSPLRAVPNALAQSAVYLSNYCLTKLKAIAPLLVEVDLLQA